MKPFRYCPSCSTRLEERDSDGAARCPNCGRMWYENAAPTVGAGIVRNGRALVTRRAFDPEQGRFDVPGGFLHADEHPVAGLKREVAEELGVEVEVSTEDLVVFAPHRYGAGGNWNLALGFVARLVAGEPRPADDVAEVAWVTRAELDGLGFAWAHDRELLHRAFDRAE
jgi:ADP-ribose pyrophosphatase YjhB (NUDIX family)